MKPTKSILCRFLSSILTLLFVMAVFPPISAFALDESAYLNPSQYLVDEEGNFVQSINTLQGLGYEHAPNLNGWQLENNSIDLWIFSSAMTADGKADGSVPPYAYDNAGNKYELKQVAITNQLNAVGQDKRVLMDSAEISAATDKTDYTKSTAELTMDPYVLQNRNIYFVAFGWSLVQETTNEEYHVSYDLNLPTSIPKDSMTLFPVMSPGSVSPDDSNGSLGMVEGYVTKLDKVVYSDKNYTVSDFDSVHDGAEYTDFLVFNYKNNSDYYTFDGWTVKDKDDVDTVYTIGQELTPSKMAALADDSGNIKFVGKWSEIKPMTDEELQNASDTLTLNALVGVDSQPLITQSVNEGPATGNDVELKEDDIISYTVETKLYGDMISNTGATGLNTQSGFAQFTYQVKVDSNLEFANLNDDGMATLTFTSNEFELTGTNIKDPEINSGPDTWTITFDPENVPVEDGSLYITVSMNSRSTSLKDSGNPIKLSGLDFKAKADQYGVVPKIETSANVVGSIDLHKKAMQPRAYYWSVNDLLSYPAWKQYFNAEEDTPIAVVHASQFIDSKLTKIDLANDNMGLKANTVVANSEDDKISYPALDKKVKGNGDTEWVDTGITAPAGEEVSFQLNSNVPQDLLNYITPDEADPPAVLSTLDSVPAETVRGSYPLVIHDQMADKLALVPGSFEVKLGSTELANVTEYSVLIPGTESESPCTFEILIDLAKLYKNGKITVDDIQNATPITVTYTATLADDVAAGTYQNTAWVTYPKGESSPDTVTVDTFGIKIFKYDQSTATGENDTWTATGLSGARFKLYQKNGDEEVIVNDDLTSDKDGYASVQGLDVGTYYLKETDAPDGYICSDEEVTITISTGDDSDAGDDNIVNVKFANSKVPHTGGTGTVMYTVGGLAIIVLAGILLVVYRKSRKKQDR